MTTTKISRDNLKFMNNVLDILEGFEDFGNVKIFDDPVTNEYGDEIFVNVVFNNENTALDDLFTYFYEIDYATTNEYGYTDEDFYDVEEYPNGADVIPLCAELHFIQDVNEVLYNFVDFKIKAR